MKKTTIRSHKLKQNVGWIATTLSNRIEHLTRANSEPTPLPPTCIGVTPPVAADAQLRRREPRQNQKRRGTEDKRSNSQISLLGFCFYFFLIFRSTPGYSFYSQANKAGPLLQG
jgi:hypothetical protein